jgi:hypothetical protein
VIRASARALGQWFFEDGDASAAALLRIAYGAVCLFMLWDLWPVLDLLLGHAGYFGTLDPRFVPAPGLDTLLFYFDSPGALRVWFWSFVGVAIAVTAGLGTRVALGLSTLFLVLLHRRNPFMLFGADGVLMHVSLWLLFLRAGRVWSVDAGLEALRGSSLENDTLVAAQGPADPDGVHLCGGGPGQAGNGSVARWIGRVLRPPQHRE